MNPENGSAIRRVASRSNSPPSSIAANPLEKIGCGPQARDPTALYFAIPPNSSFDLYLET
jgi:hypothetical protein